MHLAVLPVHDRHLKGHICQKCQYTKKNLYPQAPPPPLYFSVCSVASLTGVSAVHLPHTEKKRATLP